MALDRMKTYYTPDEELLPPDENQQFEQKWTDPGTLAALGEGEGGLSALEDTASAFAKRKMDVPYALRKAIQDKTPIDPRATMAFLESGKQAPADKLPPFTPFPASRETIDPRATMAFLEAGTQAPADKLPPITPFPVSKTVTFPRALEQAMSKQGLVGDLKAPVEMPETVPSLSMPNGVPAKTSDFAVLQKLMSPGSLASPIPVAKVPAGADIPGAVKTAIPATTPTQPAPSPDGAGGDDELGRLSMGQALVRALEGSGSVISGQNLRSGAADTLGERMKQIEALRAKKAEQETVNAREIANNQAQVDYLMSRFPERKDSLSKLYGMTGKQNFPQLVRLEEQMALDAAKRGDIGAKTEERGKAAEYRAGVLGLRKDTAEENKRYHNIQAGLKQAELDLRRAENERKVSGAAEPSAKERNTFQTMMKPAESTAVALKDAANLDTISGGMLSTGKPPPFLTRGAIAQFNLGDAARGELAKSNPEAFDLLTEMARLKTMVGHEYFGSALSPSEAERQRQFLDFGMLDSPESVATKMKNYRAALANKASVFLRPRVVSHPLGAEWVQTSGLDALSGEGGTFAGLLEAPKTAVAKAPRAVTPVSAGGVSEPKAKIPPPQAAVEFLKKNPDQAAMFDLKYGAGSAAEYLGGGR